MSIFSIFQSGLAKSATRLTRAVTSIFTGIKAHGEASFNDLEDLLISADFGVPAARRIAAASSGVAGHFAWKSSGIRASLPRLQSNYTHAVSASASTAPSDSLTNRYRRFDRNRWKSCTHVHSAIRSPAKHGFL